jgi:predicted secreted Zn-dependent protease
VWRDLVIFVMVALSGCVAPRHLTRPVDTLPQSAWPSDTAIHWYDVEGASARELRAELDRLGPLDAQGRRFDAFTEWAVTWHPPLEHSEQGCTIGAVETRLRVTVTLPRWLSPLEATASPDRVEAPRAANDSPEAERDDQPQPTEVAPYDNQALVDRWRRYLDALCGCEGGHRDNGLRAASEIAELLPHLPAAPTCELADEAANAAARLVVERYRAQDEQYDADTRHGAGQGAVFP